MIPEPKKPYEICSHCGNHALWEKSSAPESIRLPNIYWRTTNHEECEKLLAKKANEISINAYKAENIKIRKENLDRWGRNNKAPNEWRSFTFENYHSSKENDDAISTAKKLKPDDNFGIIIYGPAGTGKSHIGFSHLNRIFDKYLLPEFDLSVLSSEDPDSRNDLEIRKIDSIKYTQAAEFIAETKKKNNEIELGVLHAQILFFDDLGSESINEWSREILFRLFEHRSSHKLQTIVTTNLNLRELRERLHERVSSRILSSCVPIKIIGSDYRRNLLNEKLKILSSR
jgi:DNA replication protein DnaC